MLFARLRIALRYVRSNRNRRKHALLPIYATGPTEVLQRCKTTVGPVTQAEHQAICLLVRFRPVSSQVQPFLSLIAVNQLEQPVYGLGLRYVPGHAFLPAVE